MPGLLNKVSSRISASKFSRRLLVFISSIYGRVVLITVGSLMFLLIISNILFRSLYNEYFNNSLHQTGNNISSIVEGALYYSMLENDKGMLQRTLDVISTMSGIDEVNLYDQLDNLAYTSMPVKLVNNHDPDSMLSSDDLNELFPNKEDKYRIVENFNEEGNNQDRINTRQLLIRKPILNERSCFAAACHAHPESEELLGTLIIKLPLEDLDALVDESSTDFFILVTLITLLLVTFLIIFTRQKIQNPLKSIIMASEAVSKGNNSIRLDIKPNLLNDMRKVSQAFNNMLDNIDNATHELQNWSQQLEYKVQRKTEELLEAQNELINVERIASLGKLSSSVAHEINNPLSGILVYAKLIHKQLSGPGYNHPRKETILRNLRLIESETKRCGDIVKGLLDFSRKDQEDFVEKELHPILEGTYNLMTHSIKIANINFLKVFHAESNRIKCSPNQIKQAFVALLVNASEAIQGPGEIIMYTNNPDPDTIRVEITDTGQGIAPQDIPHIFEPFFSTKHDVSGIGLGLSIVHGIVENHNGKIEVESQPGQGTTISIIFPLCKNKT